MHEVEPVASTSAAALAADKAAAVAAAVAAEAKVIHIDDSSNGSSQNSSRPQSSNVIPVAKPEPAPVVEEDKEEVITTASGVKIFKRIAAKNNEIKLTFGKTHGDKLKLEGINVPGASNADEAETAFKALKSKTRAVRKGNRKQKAAFVSKLDGEGNVAHTKEEFVNEQDANQPAVSSAIWRPVDIKKEPLDEDEEEEVDGEENRDEEGKTQRNLHDRIEARDRRQTIDFENTRRAHALNV